jgi:hypothetical protein
MEEFMDAEADPAETTFRLREIGLTWRRVGDEVVALDTGRSVYLAVNRTAAALWPALAEGSTRRQLLSIALARFQVEPERAATEIDFLLADLAARGLLDRSPSAYRG